VARLAHVNSGLPRCFLHHTLDDTPIVCPKGQPGDAFADNYRRICQEIGQTLTTDDPNGVKAFSKQTKGTVLGYVFDTAAGTWLLPDEKLYDMARLAEVALMPGGEGLTLKKIQELLEKL